MNTIVIKKVHIFTS